MKKKKKTLLWSILPKADEEDAQTSYLFGTMHVRDQRAFGFLEKVYEKIDDCQAFATEFNLEEMNTQATANMMDLPDSLSLKDLLRPKKYKKVNRVFQKTTGFDLDFFQNSKPFMITSLISEAILSKDMPYSLDESLWRYAKEKNKAIFGLETYQQQIDIIQKIPLDSQVSALAKIGSNFGKFRRQLLQMTDNYAEADLQKLYREAKKNAGELRKVLLFERNITMADKIQEITQSQSLFAAIGAGHLGGKKGVLRLLKQKGFKVKPVGRS